LDVARDVNETAAIVLGAKEKGKSAVLMLGGGSPKNFVLQTEPHIQEILGIEGAGHDYYLQLTDARPDTGGLRDGQAVTWGRWTDQLLMLFLLWGYTIALPLLTAYAVVSRPPGPFRLYDRRETLSAAFKNAQKQKEDVMLLPPDNFLALPKQFGTRKVRQCPSCAI
jgi:deoxyhypusine synthase